jgi:hypothetical protein
LKKEKYISEDERRGFKVPKWICPFQMED